MPEKSPIQGFRWHFGEMADETFRILIYRDARECVLRIINAAFSSWVFAVPFSFKSSSREARLCIENGAETVSVARHRERFAIAAPPCLRKEMLFQILARARPALDIRSHCCAAAEWFSRSRSQEFARRREQRDRQKTR